MRYSENFAHQHAMGKSTWHMEWCTKYRYKIFKSDYHKNICMIALEEAAKKAQIVLLEREVEPEHIHLIAEMPLTVAPISAISKLKGISARIIFALRPRLRLRYPKGHLWSTGKFAISVGNITLEKAKEYVKNQKAHHAKELITSFGGIPARGTKWSELPEGQSFRTGRRSISLFNQEFVWIL